MSTSDEHEPPSTDRRLAALSAQEESISPERAGLRRVADAVRRVIHAMHGVDADLAAFEDAGSALEAAAERLEGYETRSVHGFGEAANSGDPFGFFEFSPVLGRGNPLAAPLVLQQTDGQYIEATARFGAAYEGPPGCVHGGYVAAAFDDVLGLAQSLSGQHGMTANLTIDYRSPTPLHEELRFRGHFERAEGRKIFTTGTLHAGNRLCAEARGLFVSVDFDRFATLRAERERRRAERD